MYDRFEYLVTGGCGASPSLVQQQQIARTIVVFARMCGCCLDFWLDTLNSFVISELSREDSKPISASRQLEGLYKTNSSMASLLDCKISM